MGRIVLFAAALSLVAASAQAQTFTGQLVGGRIVAACAGASYTVGTNNAVQMTATGQLCTNASGGGAVTIADGANVVEGAIADAAATVGGTGTLSAKLRRITTQLDSIQTNTAASLPAGSALIGNVGGPQTNGAAATGGGVRNMGKDGSGNAQDLITSTTGVLDSPRAGTANRVVTKTNLTLNTNTTVCPTATATAPISTELFFTTAGVGISLAGGTLTTATIGTTASTTPDLSFGTANTLYTFPVSPTNAITAYGAAGIVVCIQTLRQ